MTTDYKTKRRKTKDAILVATLAHVDFDGWSWQALEAGCEDAGHTKADAERFFPGGLRDLAEHFSDWADRTMLVALADKNLDEMKVREKIPTAVKTRLEIFGPYREAIRRLVGFLSLPQNAAVGAKATYNAVDAMWYAAGDTSADFNFYTKRATLAAVYGSTLLFWLNDESENFQDSWEFLDRRIQNVMQIPKVRGKITEACGRLPNPLRAVKEGLDRAASKARRASA